MIYFDIEKIEKIVAAGENGGYLQYFLFQQFCLNFFTWGYFYLEYYKLVVMKGSNSQSFYQKKKNWNLLKMSTVTNIINQWVSATLS